LLEVKGPVCLLLKASVSDFQAIDHPYGSSGYGPKISNVSIPVLYDKIYYIKYIHNHGGYTYQHFMEISLD